jgi:hypothetical protein
MKIWIKILLGFFAAIFLVVVLIYKFYINKPHPDYAKEIPVFTLKADELYNEFKNNQKQAEAKYNGKIIEINGKIKNIETKDSLIIVVFSFSSDEFGDEGIRCTLLDEFKDKVSKVKENEYLAVKGLCTGYNSTDVILEKCSLIK